MTAPDKPEGLIAGGEQVRSEASHNTPPAEEDRGELYSPDAIEIARAVVARPDLFPEKEWTMRLARALLSSPRAEGETAEKWYREGMLHAATVAGFFNGARAARAEILSLANNSDVMKHNVDAIRSLSPQGE